MPSGLDEDADVEEGPVLSPEELDISNDERVKEIDDGRYVVSSGGPVTDQQSESTRELEAGSSDTPESEEYKTEPNPAIDQNDDPTPLGPADQDPEPAASSTLDARSVHNWLSEDLQASNSQYAFDITANFEGNVSQQRMVSNDVVTTFESLVMWYAQQTDRSTPVGEILGILLMESNVPVRYPPKAIRNALKSTSLSADDTIADLMEEVVENKGLQM